MGLSGLSLAWHRAGGGVGAALSLFIGAFAAIGFALLLALTVWRGLRHGDAVREDWHHPVRHAFFAT
ncbi:MAG: hypothetical protein RL087_1984, partial [Pseudomonadota bacterium]